MFDADIETLYKAQVEALLKRLKSDDHPPIIRWDRRSERAAAIILMAPYHQELESFFRLLITRYLLPERENRILASFSIVHPIPSAGEGEFFLAELVVGFEGEEDLLLAERNFSFTRSELLMGIRSAYHARKVLQMKRIDPSEKSILVQERLRASIRRFPKVFDADLLLQMQHLFATVKSSFKAEHSPMHTADVIKALYKVRKQIQREASTQPGRRHCRIRIRPVRLQTPFGMREELAVTGGINFLKEHELFDEARLLSAMQRVLGSLQSRPGTFYDYEGDDQQVLTFYQEFEWDKPINRRDIRQIEENLEREVMRAVKQLMPPIFMPRNEEEVMRNVLTLSHQIKMVRDLPHTMIHFDEQEGSHLTFTLIVVRVILPQSKPIEELLSVSSLDVSIDRVKVVGQMRRKYPKEATVVRIRLESNRFLRADFSVDLIQARQHLLAEVIAVIGPVRDFNGGMIAKQDENFARLKECIAPLASENPVLLQNFFHSIHPIAMSSTTDPQVLAKLFETLVQSIDCSQETGLFNTAKQHDVLYVVIKCIDFSWKEQIFRKIAALKLSSGVLLSIQMQMYDTCYLGFIYFSPDVTKQQEFLQVLPEAFSCVL